MAGRRATRESHSSLVFETVPLLEAFSLRRLRNQQASRAKFNAPGGGWALDEGVAEEGESETAGGGEEIERERQRGADVFCWSFWLH